MADGRSMPQDDQRPSGSGSQAPKAFINGHDHIYGYRYHVDADADDDDDCASSNSVTMSPIHPMYISRISTWFVAA